MVYIYIYLYTYIYHKNQPNVGKYTNPMGSCGNDQWQSYSHHSVKITFNPKRFHGLLSFFCWHLATSPGPSNAIVDAFFKNRWVFRTLNLKRNIPSWNQKLASPSRCFVLAKKIGPFCRMFLIFLYKVYFLLNQLFVNFQGTITYPTKTGSSENHRLKRTKR